MSRDTVPSLTVLDPGLFFEGGHHASIARVLTEQAQIAELDCQVWGLNRIDHPPEGIIIKERFTHSAYAPVDKSDPEAALYSYNNSILADLQANDDEIGSDVLFFPTITSRIALGVAEWIAENYLRTNRQYIMMLMFPPGFGAVDSEAETQIYKESLTILNTVPRERLRIYAETSGIEHTFESLGAQGVSTLPWPVTVHNSGIDTGLNRNPVIGHIGYSKIESGFGLLPGIARSISKSHPHAKFIVQSNSWNDQTVDRCTASLEKIPAVEIIRGPMPPDRYTSVLNSIDIVLLPYKAQAYRERGSGVFVEAASYGRVLVIPDQTWMAHEATRSQLGAVTFDSFSEESVIRAVDSAISRFEELHEIAQRSVTTWNAQRCPTKFFNAIMGLHAGIYPSLEGVDQ